jgi:aminoglycoside phosphotransferase (APT) family kinase protein
VNYDDCTSEAIERRLRTTWTTACLATTPEPLTGGFWASMYRLRLTGQPSDVPSEVVFRIAPDLAMGAKELAVQRSVAQTGYPTPRVHLSANGDDELPGIWSVMDFAEGSPPLADLNGLGALRSAPRLFGRLPAQLAAPMVQLHAIDPALVTDAVESEAPSVAWNAGDLLDHYELAAETFDRADLATAARSLAGTRPPERSSVICHGDLHPFNLLVREDGEITVLDWTAALLGDPAYDAAFTAMLLANPPLDARGPLGKVVQTVGARLARRFITDYRARAPEGSLENLNWYSALHSLRILIQVADIEHGSADGLGQHPFGALLPAAVSTLRQATGAPVAARA